MWRELQDRGSIATSLENLGSVVYEQGDLASAYALMAESLATRQQLGDRLGMAISLEGRAAVVAAPGSPSRAANNWGATARLREEIGSPLSPKDQSRLDGRMAAPRAAMGGAAAFDRAVQEGRALTVEQAIGLAVGKTAEPS
jgi:non-specific serine/threonine protein kinase